MIPDDLTIPAAVIGMAVLTVMAAGLFSSYQRAQAYKRLRIQHLMMHVQRMEMLLAQLASVSLPREVRVLLRQDIHDRYRTVARMYARYPQIQHLVVQSEQRCASEGVEKGKMVPVAQDYAVLEELQQAFTALLQIIQDDGLLKSLPMDLRLRYRTQILERQAETVFGYFMNQADKCKTDGRQAMARGQLQQLTERLRGLGIKTERIEELLKQAEEAYQYLLTGAVAAPEAVDKSGVVST